MQQDNSKSFRTNEIWVRQRMYTGFQKQQGYEIARVSLWKTKMKIVQVLKHRWEALWKKTRIKMKTSTNTVFPYSRIFVKNNLMSQEKHDGKNAEKQFLTVLTQQHRIKWNGRMQNHSITTIWISQCRKNELLAHNQVKCR